MFYNDDLHRESYDLFMTAILLVTCILSPYSIAFITVEGFSMRIISAVTDVLFFIDMLVIFNTAIHDEDMQLIVDRKKIAIKYLKGWFLIDLFAIIPFDLIL